MDKENSEKPSSSKNEEEILKKARIRKRTLSSNFKIPAGISMWEGVFDPIKEKPQYDEWVAFQFDNNEYHLNVGILRGRIYLASLIVSGQEERKEKVDLKLDFEPTEAMINLQIENPELIKDLELYFDAFTFRGIRPKDTNSYFEDYRGANYYTSYLGYTDHKSWLIYREEDRWKIKLLEGEKGAEKLDVMLDIFQKRIDPIQEED